MGRYRLRTMAAITTLAMFGAAWVGCSQPPLPTPAPLLTEAGAIAVVQKHLLTISVDGTNCFVEVARVEGSWADAMAIYSGLGTWEVTLGKSRWQVSDDVLLQALGLLVRSLNRTC